MKSTLMIKGTHCPSCKMLIEDICKDIPGVQSCVVDFKSGKAIVEHESKNELKKIKEEVEKVGEYKVKMP